MLIKELEKINFILLTGKVLFYQGGITICDYRSKK